MQKAENIECSDSDCEGADISWEDGMPFVFDDGVTYQSMNLDMSERCVYMNLNPASHREGSYQDLMCGDVQMALCAAPCHGGETRQGTRSGPVASCGTRHQCVLLSLCHNQLALFVTSKTVEPFE